MLKRWKKAHGTIWPAMDSRHLWSDFKIIDKIHQVDEISEPIPENKAHYEKLLYAYEAAGRYQ